MAAHASGLVLHLCPPGSPRAGASAPWASMRPEDVWGGVHPSAAHDPMPPVGCWGDSAFATRIPILSRPLERTFFILRSRRYWRLAKGVGRKDKEPPAGRPDGGPAWPQQQLGASQGRARMSGGGVSLGPGRGGRCQRLDLRPAVTLRGLVGAQGHPSLLHQAQLRPAPGLP